MQDMIMFGGGRSDAAFLGTKHLAEKFAFLVLVLKGRGFKPRRFRTGSGAFFATSRPCTSPIDL
jgi:hypothetical protein